VFSHFATKAIIGKSLFSYFATKAIVGKSALSYFATKTFFENRYFPICCDCSLGSIFDPKLVYSSSENLSVDDGSNEKAPPVE